jgi:polyphosphate glucokinase
LRRKKTHNRGRGEPPRAEVGNATWSRRVRRMIDTLHVLLYWDHLYLGGGNAARVKGTLPAGVSRIDNAAGILGGIRLWDQEAL